MPKPMNAIPDDVKVLVLCVGSGGYRQISASTDSDGKPVRRYAKDMISIGSYTHPTAGWQLDVTSGDLDAYVSNFSKFQERGIKVPITVDHKKGAEAVRGELVEVRREGDWVVGVHELHGQKAIDLTDQPAVETSVEIDLDYVAAKDAEEIGSCITASSLVQRPIVPGQDTFKIAASRTGAETDAPALKKETGATKPMKDIIKKINEKLGLSIAEDADEAAIIEAVEGFEAPEDQSQAVLDLTRERDDFKAKATAAPAKIELSRNEKVGATKNLKTELSGLVSGGHILKIVAEKLQPVLSTDLMLSVPDGANDYGFGQVIEALKENDAIKLGEQTKKQLVEAGTITDKVETADPELEDRAKAAYG